MSDNVKDLIAARDKKKGGEEEDANAFYSTLGGGGSDSRFLDLRFSDGQRAAFSYGDLVWFNLHPQGTIADLEFNGILITIEGRGLRPLYENLLDRKVRWVREADSNWEDSDNVETVVARISITPPEGSGGEQES